MPRLFVAIDLPDATKDRILSLRERACRLGAGRGARHCT